MHECAMREIAEKRDPSVGGLLRLVDVKPQHEARRYLGLRKPGGVGRVYGGQVVGQALMAATKTVSRERLCHSLHCYFMRPASEEHEIDYRVEDDMDGGAFSNRHVVASQQGKSIFTMTASFHRREQGFEHSSAMPSAPAPEDLPDAGAQALAQGEGEARVVRSMSQMLAPIEFRPVEPWNRHQTTARDVMCWFRVGAGPVDCDQATQRVLLALASDAMLLGVAGRSHGLSFLSPTIQAASIDHSVWFHNDVECGEWLLYVIDSPWAGGARGFSRGQIFSREGMLVASVMQEGLMRPIQKSS